MDVEVADIYEKFVITKKKHYIGISQEESKEPVIKGMEGIKSDRPPWINKIERQLADDIKGSKDPTINIQKVYSAMKYGEVPLQELEIKLVLAKDTSKYGEHSLQRIVGNELGAKQGEMIVYYKSDTIGGGTSNYNLLSRRKYLEMLRATLEDSLKAMGYDYLLDIVGFESLDKCDGYAKR